MGQNRRRGGGGGEKTFPLVSLPFTCPSSLSFASLLLSRWCRNQCTSEHSLKQTKKTPALQAKEIKATRRKSQLSVMTTDKWNKIHVRSY